MCFNQFFVCSLYLLNLILTLFVLWAKTKVKKLLKLRAGSRGGGIIRAMPERKGVFGTSSLTLTRTHVKRKGHKTQVTEFVRSPR